MKNLIQTFADPVLLTCSLHCMKILTTLLFAAPFLLCCSFEGPQENHLSRWLEIAGRDSGRPGEERPCIYRVKLPFHWVYCPPSTDCSLYDTKKAIAEFFIYDDEGEIRITIHNFPNDSLKERIPPAAQISRWQQQLDHPDTSTIEIKPLSSGGFAGLSFDGEGELEGERQRILGWAMQIGPEHYMTLQVPQSKLPETRRRQMRADYTIKAIGPTTLMEKYKEEIIRFSRCFELIDEIPMAQ